MTCSVVQLLLACFWSAGCTQEQSAIERHRRHPGRQFEAHADRASSLIERIKDMPPAVLSYLIADGTINGFTAKPRPHALNRQEREVVADTISALPAEIRVLAERNIAAIYFVDDLGSSAWTEFLDPPVRQSFIVFDALVLRETPNVWATRKERSGFADGTEVRLEIADPQNDVPGGGFRFIFLHELGHAIAYELRLHPTWVDETGGEFPYVRLVSGAKSFAPGVPFYTTPNKRLPATRAKDIYARWAESSHSTLHATVSLEEDFAESFASYVHVQMLQQPYRLSVGAERYENGILQPRCAEKRAFVAAILKQ